MRTNKATVTISYLASIYLLFLVLAVSTRTIPENSEDDTSCHISFNNEQLNSELTSEIVQDCLDAFPMRNLTGSTSNEEKLQIIAENENNVRNLFEAT